MNSVPCDTSRNTPPFSPLAIAICTAIGTFFVPPVFAGMPAPPLVPSLDAIGGEIQVNTAFSGGQRNPAVAMDADGDFVVVWDGNKDGEDPGGVYGQRFDADGVKTGTTDFLVNNVHTLSQRNAAVAMDADGDFVVVWQSYDVTVGSGIYARKYNADGSDASGEFLVSAKILSQLNNPDVAMDADGDFVVVWDFYDANVATKNVFARRYTKDSVAQGNEFMVNTSIDTGTVLGKSNPSVAMDADGDFVVAWDNRPFNTGASILQAQRFNSDGSKIDAELTVSSNPSAFQNNPDVAMDANGDFAVVWQQLNPSGRDIYKRQFNASGVSIDANDVLVDTDLSTSEQRFPSIAMDADGDFIVAWETNHYDITFGTKFEIYAQRYNADGSDGTNFSVNTHVPDDQQGATVAIDADGDAVISWQSKYQDGSLEGVYAQRYSRANETVDLNLVVNDDTDPVTVGNNFIYSLITTNNGTGVAMDVNLSEPLPAGITYVSDDSAAAGWTCGMGATSLECNLPFMNPGATNTINVTVTASTAGTANNAVTASSAHVDVKPSDNMDSETTDIIGAVEEAIAAASGGGSSSLSWLTGLLLVPFALRRRRKG